MNMLNLKELSVYCFHPSPPKPAMAKTGLEPGSKVEVSQVSSQHLLATSRLCTKTQLELGVGDGTPT